MWSVGLLLYFGTQVAALCPGECMKKACSEADKVALLSGDDSCPEFARNCCVDPACTADLCIPDEHWNEHGCGIKAASAKCYDTTFQSGGGNPCRHGACHCCNKPATFTPCTTHDKIIECFDAGKKICEKVNDVEKCVDSDFKFRLTTLPIGSINWGILNAGRKEAAFVKSYRDARVAYYTGYISGRSARGATHDLFGSFQEMKRLEDELTRPFNPWRIVDTDQPLMENFARPPTPYIDKAKLFQNLDLLKKQQSAPATADFRIFEALKQPTFKTTTQKLLIKLPVKEVMKDAGELPLHHTDILFPPIEARASRVIDVTLSVQEVEWIWKVELFWFYIGQVFGFLEHPMSHKLLAMFKNRRFACDMSFASDLGPGMRSRGGGWHVDGFYNRKQLENAWQGDKLSIKRKQFRNRVLAPVDVEQGADDHEQAGPGGNVGTKGFCVPVHFVITDRSPTLFWIPRLERVLSKAELDHLLTFKCDKGIHPGPECRGHEMIYWLLGGTYQEPTDIVHTSGNFHTLNNKNVSLCHFEECRNEPQPQYVVGILNAKVQDVCPRNWIPENKKTQTICEEETIDEDVKKTGASHKLSAKHGVTLERVEVQSGGDADNPKGWQWRDYFLKRLADYNLEAEELDSFVAPAGQPYEMGLMGPYRIHLAGMDDKTTDMNGRSLNRFFLRYVFEPDEHCFFELPEFKQRMSTFDRADCWATPIATSSTELSTTEDLSADCLSQNDHDAISHVD